MSHPTHHRPFLRFLFPAGGTHFSRTRTVCLIGVGLLCASFCRAAPVRSLSQYGITWEFEHPVLSGTFVTGDPWVVGPVTVVAVTPAPGPVEGDGGDTVRSRYGAAATRADSRMRNGSMIVKGPSGTQGYDSRLRNYRPEDSVTFPVQLKPGHSLISSISNPDESSDHLMRDRMWKSEQQGFWVLKTAAVLTVLASPPPPDAFRPAYAGPNKPLHRMADLNVDRLRRLSPPSDPLPWKEFERYFQRPWLDHMNGWLHQHLGPNENQVNYGREFARATGMAALLLQMDVPLEQKKELTIGLVQLGIDLMGLADAGREHVADGGHYSGRKFPILFAGHLLDDSRMLSVSRETNFAEDQQTYYGEGWGGWSALYQIVTHTGKRPPYEHKLPETWDKQDWRSEMYRVVNGTAWPATALAVRLLGLEEAWGHDVWLDFADRWMTAEDPYADTRARTPVERMQKRPRQEGSTHDGFVDWMWKTYRPGLGRLNRTGPHRKWVWTSQGGRWEENAPPSSPPPPYVAPKIK